MKKTELKKLTYKVLRHWENNVVAAVKVDRERWSKSWQVCAYCREWLHQFAGGCRGCPVFKDTELTNCEGTPYSETNYLDRDDSWTEFQYLLNMAYSQGLEGYYMKEIS